MPEVVKALVDCLGGILAGLVALMGFDIVAVAAGGLNLQTKEIHCFLAS